LETKIKLLEQANAALVTDNARLSGELEDALTRLDAKIFELLEAIAEKARVEGERDLIMSQFEKLHKEFRKLDKYRSEFFEKLSLALEGVEGVTIKGDRFILQAEVFFESGSAEVSKAGNARIVMVARAVEELQSIIPSDIEWILQVNGHTDIERISSGSKFRDNWQLSTERALAVVGVLISAGAPPEHLAAAGYGKFQPFNTGSELVDLASNRRIELHLTSN
jgi:chemotaxis protein MotB